MKILFVAAEVAPLAKVGGLADVAGALPLALSDAGHDVRVLMPYYGLIDSTASTAPAHVATAMDDTLLDRVAGPVSLAETRLRDRVPVYLLKAERWFHSARRSEDLYTSDPDAYIAFGRAAAVIVRDGIGGWVPDVLHCHDWHAGLAPVYSRLMTSGVRPASVFTVHNLAYSGFFPADVFERAGLPPSLFTMEALEYYGGFSFLKAGIVDADMVNTVSPQYAREVETEEYGGGMAGLMRHTREQGRFVGIVNGIDPDVHDPSKDPDLPVHYSVENLAGKSVCKAALQRDVGLIEDPNLPVIGMVSRICHQKGHDVVAQAASMIVDAGAQVVILGVGDPEMTAALLAAAGAHPGMFAVRIGYDAYLASRIYAGSDMFLMPSRFEPCGLGQLIAMRYGSVPVVRRTGGLADTVRDAESHPRVGNGFVFEELDAAPMLEAIERAVGAYKKRSVWQRIQLRGMRADYSWGKAVVQYEKLYRRAISNRDRKSGREVSLTGASPVRE